MITLIATVDGQETETTYNAPKHEIAIEFVAKHFSPVFREARPTVAREIAKTLIINKLGQCSAETNFDGLEITSADGYRKAKIEIIV